MSSFFLAVFLMIAGVLILFLPIIIELNTHADLNGKKLAFSMYVYGVLRVIGGYVGVYPGGVVLHVGKKKAFLLPYSNMEKERKRFSFVRAFHIRKMEISTLTGVEYAAPSMLVHSVSLLYVKARGGKQRGNIWVTNGDLLKVTARIVVDFNLFLICKLLVLFLKEKVQCLIRKKRKKSIC
jgi:hypothetical protein